jgi:hypothetical protein
MPLISALGRQRQADVLSFWGQPGLQSEFQDSQGYTEKPCRGNKQTDKECKCDYVAEALAFTHFSLGIFLL